MDRDEIIGRLNFLKKWNYKFSKIRFFLFLYFLNSFLLRIG
jgi:hypothetical protein